MKTRCGHPRKLSDRQIRKVMKWHQEAIEFRRAHGTHRDLARLLGVSLHAVRGCFESKIPHAPKSRARRGRPRHLDADQIAFVLAWRRVAWQFQARHGSIPGLARKLGVGASTIHDCVRRGRPRHLDADQTAFVLAWRRVAWQFQARYGSVPGLARKLGVGASTIYDCVRRKGRYIQFAYVDGYQAHISRRGHPSLSDNAVRARLLRAWRSPYLKSSRAAVKR